jgi:hypothetical protein
MKKIRLVFVALVLITAGFLSGAVFGTLQSFKNQTPDIPLSQSDENCVEIKNDFPIIQKDFDSYGVQLTTYTLYMGYHKFCKN